MITNTLIKQLYEQWQKDAHIFLVDVSVKPGNKITILIDRVDGLQITDCVELSRFIEGSLDREKEDFELSVSSPGADAPFKVNRQYEKNIGRKVKVTTKDNETITGILTAISDSAIEISPEKKSKLSVPRLINLTNIKETRVIISFK
jgi:ribosome maturation factor RimP